MTKPNPLPSLAELNDLLDYDPETGLFTWKKSRRGTARAGSTAGRLHKYTGYVYIYIKSKFYLAHRLAYKMYHGSDPVDMLDHIDMDRANNRIANLRDATRTQNGGNSKSKKNSFSGVKGVQANRNLAKSGISTASPWKAHITFNKKKIHLGCYKTKEEAAIAYEKAAKEYFGDFARTE